MVEALARRQLVLYIATSLDGYIARPSGEIDWLIADDQDYGYNEFLAEVDTVLMGRKTYEQILSFGVEYPYQAKENYVFTHDEQFQPSSHATVVHSDVAAFISNLRSTEGKNIWLVGGAELIRYCMAYKLLDQMIIFIQPIVLGAGIPLFLSGIPETSLRCTHCQSYANGMVQVSYTVFA